jgi:hypothetical protein
MYYINSEKQFKILNSRRELGAILFGVEGYSYTDGKQIVEIGEKKDLCSFLFHEKVAYLDECRNLRAMILGYEASQAALFEGRTLLDANGNSFQYEKETNMVRINGGTHVIQLPFGKYIIDWERNYEIEEERKRAEEERKMAAAEEEARRKTSKNNGSSWKAGLAALAGLVIVGGLVFRK